MMIDPGDRARIAAHEAGHCIVAEALHLRPSSVVAIGNEDRASGWTRHSSTADPVKAPAVDLAGMLADIAFGADQDDAANRASGDLEHAHELAATTADPGATMDQAWLIAQGIVRQHRGAIERLAADLDASFWGLSGPELASAVDAALNPAPADDDALPGGEASASLVGGRARQAARATPLRVPGGQLRFRQ